MNIKHKLGMSIIGVVLISIFIYQIAIRPTISLYEQNVRLHTQYDQIDDALAINDSLHSKVSKLRSLTLKPGTDIYDEVLNCMSQLCINHEVRLHSLTKLEDNNAIKGTTQYFLLSLQGSFSNLLMVLNGTKKRLPHLQIRSLIFRTEKKARSKSELLFMDIYFKNS